MSLRPIWLFSLQYTEYIILKAKCSSCGFSRNFCLQGSTVPNLLWCVRSLSWNETHNASRLKTRSHTSSWHLQRKRSSFILHLSESVNTYVWQHSLVDCIPQPTQLTHNIRWEHGDIEASMLLIGPWYETDPGSLMKSGFVPKHGPIKNSEIRESGPVPQMDQSEIAKSGSTRATEDNSWRSNLGASIRSRGRFRLLFK